MRIYVKRLNVVKEIDDKYLSEWEEKGFKKSGAPSKEKSSKNAGGKDDDGKKDEDGGKGGNSLFS